MSAITALFSGAPKQAKPDTSAVDAQLALQKKQQNEQDAETAARTRAVSARSSGRALLTNRATGDLGLASTLGG